MLKPAFREKAVKPPQHWHQLACGNWLKDQVEQQLAEECKRLYGYHFARVGCLSAELNLPQFAISHQFSVAPALHKKFRYRPKALTGLLQKHPSMPF